MAEKEGLNLSPRGIATVILVVMLGLASAGIGGSVLSTGASTAATEDVHTLIETILDDRESTMTLEEAEVWRAKVDRQQHVDETLQEHGKELVRLRTDVHQVQKTVDAIADKVGAIE